MPGTAPVSSPHTHQPAFLIISTINLTTHRVAIVGAGNLGCSTAEGLYASGTFSADSIYLTRRRIEKLDPYIETGFQVTADNNQAVTRSSILLICVEPHQLDQLLEEIRETVDPAEQIVISEIESASVAEIKKKLPAGTPARKSTRLNSSHVPPS